VGDVVGEFEEAEVLKELGGEHVDRVGQVDDRRADAGAGEGLGRDVAAVALGADVEFGEADDVACRGARRGGRSGGGLRDRGRERTEQREQGPGEATGNERGMGFHGGSGKGRAREMRLCSGATVD